MKRSRQVIPEATSTAAPPPEDSWANRTYKWLLRTFGVFSGEKMLRNPVLNFLGVQVLRVVLARWVVLLKRLLFFRCNDPALTELARNGIVAVHHFLPEEEFRAMAADFRARMDSGRPERSFMAGDSRIEKTDFRRPEQTPAVIKRLEKNERLLRILSAAEGRRVNLAGQMYFETVVFGASPELGKDYQNYLHRDIYFPAHKLFFTIEDVRPENGPFAYVRGSQRVSWKRLWMEYRYSARLRIAPNIRLTRAEQERYGLREIQLAAPANTLIIADVSGMHLRSEGKPGARRRLLRGGLRANPFLSI